ncbi:MAG: hypothetical protein B5M56_10190 [Desulfococcus sp. 4484_241]|nr:MAG: hypothetical protein B5M56_10190 [Desulfococcus sp. 4484_241]
MLYVIFFSSGPTKCTFSDVKLSNRHFFHTAGLHGTTECLVKFFCPGAGRVALRIFMVRPSALLNVAVTRHWPASAMRRVLQLLFIPFSQRRFRITWTN